MKHRKVKHYGYKFRYDNNLVDVDDPITPIPQCYEFLQNLFEKQGCGVFKYDQLTINRYLPGQGEFLNLIAQTLRFALTFSKPLLINSN